jgi:hypothetical protein
MFRSFPSAATGPPQLVVLHHLLNPLSLLPWLLVDAIDDLIRVVAGVLQVTVLHVTELSDELLLQLWRTLANLLLEHVVKTHVPVLCSDEVTLWHTQLAEDVTREKAASWSGRPAEPESP